MTSRAFWYTVGTLIIALLWYLSLIPKPPQFGLAYEDKVEHLLAYGGTMWWWAQLWHRFHQRALLAIGLTLMGILIEFVQRWTGWRHYDVNDMIANGIGVLIGWVAVIVWTRLLPHMPWYVPARKTAAN
jgi:VanZ family protein